MKRVHCIIDYTFLYYKYTFQLDSGKLKRLTFGDKDISQIYYSLKEIEKFRRDIVKNGDECSLTVCFDMPSMRKSTEDTGDGSTYKSNRTHRLGEEDFSNIVLVENILKEIGYNTYRVEGYEADDLVYKLSHKYKDSFDETIIVTPDMDVLVNIDDKVKAYRYKSRVGYTEVNMDNFSEYLSKELKSEEFRYNLITLYKSTVGDKSDCINGIKKFGPKAFDKLVIKLVGDGLKFSCLKDYKATLKILEYCRDKEYLTQEQYEEAYDSFSLVKPLEVPDGLLENVHDTSSDDSRIRVYGQYEMKSLYK